ncbi:MAG: serine protease [Leptolyngbyaceae cyanobacterium bins.302]|nr:serine protease [Leptolyngbyaceae cyanobacterium bins.302]
MTDQQLEKLLQRCTVRLTTTSGHGTGFFVAPGLILTCAHVVEAAIDLPISVWWAAPQQLYTAQVVQCLTDPNLDLALLTLSSPLPEHPCVLLDESMPQLDDHLYSFGYPQDNPDGDPVTSGFEGESFRGGASLHKLKDGQFHYGSSGSPLLNRRTGKVCGVVAISRNVSTDLGARAIPAWVIFSQFPALLDAQRQFHQTNLHWTITALGRRKLVRQRVWAGAVGAGAALGILRAVISPIFYLSSFIQFLHHFWAGAVLGSALTFGMVWAETRQLSSRSFPLGVVGVQTVCFGLAHLLLAISAGSLLTNAPLVAPMGFVAGLGLSVAVRDRGQLPFLVEDARSARTKTAKLSITPTYLRDHWIWRMGLAGLVFAWIQAVFLLTNQGSGLVMVWTSQMYESSLGRYADLGWWAALMQRHPQWFQYLAIVDSALSGMMLALGLMAGWQFMNHSLIKSKT